MNVSSDTIVRQQFGVRIPDESTLFREDILLAMRKEAIQDIARGIRHTCTITLGFIIGPKADVEEAVALFDILKIRNRCSLYAIGNAETLGSQ